MRFGETSVAYKILLEGYPPVKGWRRALNAAYRPSLIDPSVWLELLPSVSSAIDSSDGLAMSLVQLADASGVKIVLDEVPISGVALRASEEWGLDPLELALYEGGEEYAFIFTLREEVDLPRGFSVVGRVLEGKGVYVKSSKGLVRVEPRGWVHGRGWTREGRYRGWVH